MKSLIEAAKRAHEFRLHPLGFFYLQDGAGEGRSRRVHIWLPNGPDRPDNDRHQHSFDMVTLVVSGRMRNELFRFEEEDDGPEKEFAVAYQERSSTLTPSGRRGRLLPIASFETVVDATYSLEMGVIHRVTVTSRPCITVVKTQEHHISIFSYGHHEEIAFDRRLCTEIEAEQFRRLLADAMRRQALSILRTGSSQ